jgi:hypothetical protein
MTALAGGLLATRAAHATTTISLTTMNATLLPDDCDMINVTITPSGSIPNTRLIYLHSMPEVNAWKAIDVPQVNLPPNQPYTQDQHRFSSSYMPAQYSTLTFEKAKFLGAHTAVYTLDVSSVPLGSLIEFDWIQDTCPNFQGVADGGKSHVPPSVAPGQTFTATVAFFNGNGEPWLTDHRIQVTDHVGVWSVAPIGLPSDVFLWDDATFTFTARAPMTPGLTHFTFVLAEEGGPAIATFDKVIAVGTVQQPPPPPVQMTTVPDVVGMTLQNAFTALQNAKLKEGLLIDWDPNWTGTKIVVSQGVAPTRSVPVNTGISLLLSDAGAPEGWSEIEVFNCRRVTVQLWKAVGDRFMFIQDVPSSFTDNGMCEAHIAPVTDQLTAKAPNWYLIVDPTQPGCTSPDPANPDCDVFEWIGLGDPNGAPFEYTQQ